MVVIGCASKEAAWHRIPDVSGVPWEHAQAICGPILEQGAIARASGDGRMAYTIAERQYRTCMAQHGWTDRVL